MHDGESHHIVRFVCESVRVCWRCSQQSGDEAARGRGNRSAAGEYVFVRGVCGTAVIFVVGCCYTTGLPRPPHLAAHGRSAHQSCTRTAAHCAHRMNKRVAETVEFLGGAIHCGILLEAQGGGARRVSHTGMHTARIAQMFSRHLPIAWECSCRGCHAAATM